MNRYRAVFVSDFHLGSAGCRADAIDEFLRDFECEYLYLVGDIIDGWVGTKETKWTQGCTNVVRTVLDKSMYNVKVLYTPGNHDALVRRMLGTEHGNIYIDHSFVHETLDGRRLLVVHGDLFDSACTRFPHAAWAGAWVYEYLTIFNVHVNKHRTKREWRPIDFSTSLKLLFKRYSKKKGSFETQLLNAAAEQDCTGVVCGHIHRPQIHEYEKGLYVNTGDWVEHKTALVEHLDGRLELLDLMKEKEPESPRRSVIGLASK